MMGLILALCSGILAMLAFPKFDLYFTAWFALVPLFICLEQEEDWKKALAAGFVFGLVFASGAYFWLTSLSKWAGPAGWAAWAAFSLYQSLYCVLFAGIAFFFMKNLPRYAGVFAVPAAWISVEWIRSLGEFGAPGGLLGYTQYLNIPLIQIARFSGVYGVSFLIVMVNYGLAGVFLKDAKQRDKLFPVLAGIVLLSAAYYYGNTRINEGRFIKGALIRVAVVQPNIEQEAKLVPGNAASLIRSLSALTASVQGTPELIIWPETAVMGYLEFDKALLGTVSKEASRAGAALITGAFHSEKGRYYNSMFALLPGGMIAGRYDKQHLMPFGEYLPFRELTYALLKSTGYFENDQSPGTDAKLLPAGKYRIGCMICFESLFPDLVRKRSKGADFLLTITNDAWFGSSAGAYQHIMAGPFRAVENRKYFIQAANSGISAIIDPYGRFIASTGLGERTVLSGEIRSGNASRSPRRHNRHTAPEVSGATRAGTSSGL